MLQRGECVIQGFIFKVNSGTSIKFCPPKVELFVWMAIQGLIASKSVLVSRGILNSNTDQCPFCNSVGETPNHLLLLCNVAKRVWEEVILWWDMVWVCPPNLKTLFAYWYSFKFENLEKLCWQASFYSGVWTFRNELVFRNKMCEVEEIADLVKTRMTIWIKGKYDVRDYSIEDFKWNLAGTRKVKI